MNWNEKLHYRRALFLAFTLFVLGSSAVDIVSEFAAGEAISDMFDDVLMLLISAFIIILFGIEHFNQQRAMSELRDQLSNARGQLAEIDAKAHEIASQYRQVMQKQFDEWKLTVSEQEVALALLKGLSFREVAEIRETREKTVRQQATNIYRKSGVAGRHELAAWFFEDMLAPPPVESTLSNA